MKTNRYDPVKQHQHHATRLTTRDFGGLPLPLREHLDEWIQGHGFAGIMATSAVRGDLLRWFGERLIDYYGGHVPDNIFIKTRTDTEYSVYWDATSTRITVIFVQEDEPALLISAEGNELALRNFTEIV